MQPISLYGDSLQHTLQCCVCLREAHLGAMSRLNAYLEGAHWKWDGEGLFYCLDCHGKRC